MIICCDINLTNLASRIYQDASETLNAYKFSKALATNRICACTTCPMLLVVSDRRKNNYMYHIRNDPTFSDRYR